MTTLREAAQQALEALEYYQHRRLEWDYSDEQTITALHAALAEPVQEPTLDEAMALPRARAEAYERGWNAARATGDNLSPTEPVAWVECDGELVWNNREAAIGRNLYTTSPQRKPLSAVDLRALYDRHATYQEEGPEASGWWEFARAIEAAHGITP